MRLKDYCRSMFVAVVLLYASIGLSWAGSEGLSQQVATEVQVVLEKAIRKGGARGVSAAVRLPDGSVVTATFGYADVESGLLITPDTLFLGGSTGKTFVAATVMSLVEEGVLELDKKISTWLGDEPWFERLPNHDDITLRMLLNHSSGMPDHIYQSAFQMSLAKQHFKDSGFYFQPTELVNFVLDLPALGPAGKSYSYADTGYILIGLIVEKATGNLYYDELKSRVLDPLQLTAVVPSDSLQIEGLATGYVSGGFLNFLAGIAGKNTEDGKLNLNPAMEWTGGGLATTPASLVRFYSDLFNGQLLSESSVQEMINSTVVNPAQPGQQYGLGVFVLENEEFGKYLHHSGWYPGYITNVIYYSDPGIAVAIQYNQDYNADLYGPVKEIARRVKDLLKDQPGG